MLPLAEKRKRNGRPRSNGMSRKNLESEIVEGLSFLFKVAQLWGRRRRQWTLLLFKVATNRVFNGDLSCLSTSLNEDRVYRSLNCADGYVRLTLRERIGTSDKRRQTTVWTVDSWSSLCLEKRPLNFDVISLHDDLESLYLDEDDDDDVDGEVWQGNITREKRTIHGVNAAFIRRESLWDVTSLSGEQSWTLDERRMVRAQLILTPLTDSDRHVAMCFSSERYKNAYNTRTAFVLFGTMWIDYGWRIESTRES